LLFLIVILKTNYYIKLSIYFSILFIYHFFSLLSVRFFSLLPSFHLSFFYSFFLLLPSQFYSSQYRQTKNKSHKSNPTTVCNTNQVHKSIPQPNTQIKPQPNPQINPQLNPQPNPQIKAKPTARRTIGSKPQPNCE
jgi:hypothetical protein